MADADRRRAARGEINGELEGAVTCVGNPAGPAASAVGTRVRLRLAVAGTVTMVPPKVSGWSEVSWPDSIATPAYPLAGAEATSGWAAIHAEPAKMVARVPDPKSKIESGTAKRTVDPRQTRPFRPSGRSGSTWSLGS